MWCYGWVTLVGHFEPPLVVAHGWTRDAFVPGPLTRAMERGSVLFINEANRLVEGTQNVLLPALDEGILHIPKLGTIKAKEGFFVIATQNPESYIGTTILGEALRDRFVWVKLDYQDLENEIEIVRQKIKGHPNAEKIADISTKVTRFTRVHPDVRRGASIRGAIDMAQLLTLANSLSKDVVADIAIMALASKIDLEDGVERSVEQIITEIVEKVFSGEEPDFL